MLEPVTRRAERACAARLLTAFEATGAQRVETDVLQPADTLLDLYGEDIRGRAFTTTGTGEMMMRPDFTVPVVQAHMAEGAEPARYAYSGLVFRQQENDDTRAREYMQVGYEVFDRSDPASADAEVFALFATVLEPLGLHPATGDIGILIAAVDALDTTDRRRAALRRHIWRPRRFRALLDRFTGRSDFPSNRVDLVNDPRTAIEIAQEATPSIGLRSVAEVAARIKALREDASAPPIGKTQAEVLDLILKIDGMSVDALETLRDIEIDMPALASTVDRVEARLEALSRRGVDVETLPFATTYGRTSMEYYDGFVFGFTARPDMPPVASGGRYDALTAQLGGGRSIPAVGGVIRPGLVAQLEGAQ